MADFKALLGEINSMNREELLGMNSLIIRRLEKMTRAAVHSFRRGQRVGFSNGGCYYLGNVIKLNKKSVAVDTDDGGKWRVHPDSLYPVEGESNA